MAPSMAIEVTCASDRGRPAPDLLDVEHDVGGVDVLVDLGRANVERAEDSTSDGHGEVQAGVQLGVAAADRRRSQPT